MKVSIYINGKENQREIPINWDQVKFRQFLALETCGDDIIKVIALFTGVDYDTLLKAKIKNLDEIIAVLGFLKKPMEEVIPVTIMGYHVPKKLEFEQTQMYLDLKNSWSESRQLSAIEQLEKYTLYCAVYTCMQKDAEWCGKLIEELHIFDSRQAEELLEGRYDFRKADKMKDEFLEAPCTEVMGIGNFTLLRLIALNANINLNSQKPSTRIKRFKLAFKIYRLRMAQALRSLTWKKRLA